MNWFFLFSVNELCVFHVCELQNVLYLYDLYFIVTLTMDQGDDSDRVAKTGW